MTITGINPVALFGWAVLLLIFLIAMAALKRFLSGRRLHRWRFFVRTAARHRLSVVMQESRFHGYLIAFMILVTAGGVADHFEYRGARFVLNLMGFAGIGWLMFALPQKCVERYWSVVKASRFRICPDCYYELRGLREEGRCPECGYDFCKDHLEGDWRCLMGEAPETS